VTFLKKLAFWCVRSHTHVTTQPTTSTDRHRTTTLDALEYFCGRSERLAYELVAALSKQLISRAWLSVIACSSSITPNDKNWRH
jgi:hypothetical protein